MNELSKRMRTPIDGPLAKPIMTVSQLWYKARVDEVYNLESINAELVEVLEAIVERAYSQREQDFYSDTFEIPFAWAKQALAKARDVT